MTSVITLFFLSLSLIGHLYHQCDSFIILKSSCTCSHCSFPPAFMSHPIEWLREQLDGLGGHHKISGSELLGPGCHCFRYLHCCSAAEPKWGILPLRLPLPRAFSPTVHCSDFPCTVPLAVSITLPHSGRSARFTDTHLDSPRQPCKRERGEERERGGFPSLPSWC